MARVAELGRSVSAPAHDALAEELQRTKELVRFHTVASPPVLHHRSGYNSRFDTFLLSRGLWRISQVRVL